MGKTEMTIADKMNAMAKAIVDNKIDVGFDVEEFVADRIEKAKKKSTNKKLTEAQVWLRKAISDVLSNATTPLTVGEIMEQIDTTEAPEGVKVSSQSITANMRPFLNDTIVRTESKGVARFNLAPAPTTEVVDEFEDNAE